MRTENGPESNNLYKLYLCLHFMAIFFHVCTWVFITIDYKPLLNTNYTQWQNFQDFLQNKWSLKSGLKKYEPREGNSANMDLIRQAKERSYPWNKQTNKPWVIYFSIILINSVKNIRLVLCY